MNKKFLCIKFVSLKNFGIVVIKDFMDAFEKCPTYFLFSWYAQNYLSSKQEKDLDVKHNDRHQKLSKHLKSFLTEIIRD